ncbi:hypothetical protein GUITHDRAFT_120074 [Guillardia theta CCMP2712]|uniref:Uncharacterized protein n=1 Tax=Guillardia theta (strain CCMP2712) TaxID=905079 RepID=L1ICV5_GUITC|nr:hypothetical protein GUITHDRAFT_120074 [Guillardia theta CCMP2712]EKX33744.1 hypothetical protein GUITHDRAFT_120074 [Guillardia theta CCMP2712]|eukprot:XP_005820724.1 hypothetical protein GUITHDRAFT_120074 [Guillardia theta CCMP2712]
MSPPYILAISSLLLDDPSFNPSFLLPIDPVDVSDPSFTSLDRCFSSSTLDIFNSFLIPGTPCTIPVPDLSLTDDPSLDVLLPLPDDTAPADACRGPETSRWDAAARSKHSSACRGRSRLTAQDKADIVCLYYSAPVSPTGKRSMRQRDLSRMYGKSRAAISKVLRPEYARGVMTAGQGLMVRNRNEVLESIAEEERLKEEPMQSTWTEMMRRGPGEGGRDSTRRACEKQIDSSFVVLLAFIVYSVMLGTYNYYFCSFNKSSTPTTYGASMACAKLSEDQVVKRSPGLDQACFLQAIADDRAGVGGS